MVTCPSSELGWEVTVELPVDSLSIGSGSVKLVSEQFYAIARLFFALFLQYFL